MTDTDKVICADIHTRARTKRLVKAAGGDVVLGMDDLLTAPVNGSGYNPDYGILGSNKATEDTIKLFPINCQELVDGVQAEAQSPHRKDHRSNGLRRRSFQRPGRKDMGTG